MGGLTFLPYNQAATKRFFDGKENERKREEDKAKAKAGKGGDKKEKAVVAEEKKE